jgi:hypothetical protein
MRRGTRMWSSLHGILLEKLQCECCSVRPHAVSMDSHSSIGSPNLNSAAICEWSSNLSSLIGGLGVASLGRTLIT